MPKKKTPPPKGTVARLGLRVPNGAPPRIKKGRNRGRAKAAAAQAAADASPSATDDTATPPKKKRGKKTAAPATPAPDPNTEVPPGKTPPPTLGEVELMQHAEQIRALAGFGMSEAEITAITGINPEVLFNNAAVIGQWLVEGRAKARANVRMSLYRQAVNGSAQHISLYEQLAHGWKPTQRSEQTGKDGGPQEIEHRTVMSDDELMGRIRTLRDRFLSTLDQSVAQDRPVLPSATAEVVEGMDA